VAGTPRRGLYSGWRRVGRRAGSTTTRSLRRGARNREARSDRCFFLSSVAFQMHNANRCYFFVFRRSLKTTGLAQQVISPVISCLSTQFEQWGTRRPGPFLADRRQQIEATVRTRTTAMVPNSRPPWAAPKSSTFCQGQRPDSSRLRPLSAGYRQSNRFLWWSRSHQ